MYFSDLQEYISQLEKDDDLIRIKAEVDPYLEAAAIIDKVCKDAGDKRALLFENIKGSEIPLVANLFGSRERVAKALGVSDVELLANQIRKELSTYTRIDSSKALLQIVSNKKPATVGPKSDPCLRIDITDEGFDALPVLHSWPGDAGKYLTLGQVFTCHPESNKHNCGMYRIQIVDKETALIRFHPGAGGGEHLQAWHAKGKPMPIAIALGGPPVMTLAAATSLPRSLNEAAFVEYITGEPLPLIHCTGENLKVPGNADIIIEGYIHPGEEAAEGPFGNHTGRYADTAQAPVIKVEKLTIRKNAVYPCTVVGPPPMENAYMALATERMLLPLLQHDFPWLRDLVMPKEGIFHRVALISVSSKAKSANEIAQELVNTVLLRNAKLLVLCDEETDVNNFSNVYWQLVNIEKIDKSIVRVINTLVLDLRRVNTRAKVRTDKATLKKIDERWEAYGLGPFINTVE